jgi:hypothetical protein
MILTLEWWTASGWSEISTVVRPAGGARRKACGERRAQNARPRSGGTEREVAYAVNLRRILGREGLGQRNLDRPLAKKV